MWEPMGVDEEVAMGWFGSVEHDRWLSAQMRALLDEARGASVPTGFAHLLPEGGADPDRPIDLAVTARMTYVFSLGVLMGIPGCRRLADHGVRSLAGCFPDPVNGGWFSSIRPELDAEGAAVPWDATGRWKSQFHHAFLVFAASAATIADRPGAFELLAAALHDQERHWLDDSGLVVDAWSEDYSLPVPQRSMDTLLHTAEAYLSAAEATTDPVWVERAEAMTRFVADRARESAWRLPEYFGADLERLDAPVVRTDRRPAYDGSVIGHSMAWARLALQIRAGLRSMGRPQPDYLMEMAQELFERARADGWRRTDGEPGFVLTVDQEGRPVDARHLQWVACEGVCAAVALRRAALDDGAQPGEVEHYEHCYRSWLDFINDHIIVRPGQWRRVLDVHNEPLEPAVNNPMDVYHSIQTLLMARVPLWPPFASAISRGLLDHPEEAPRDRRSWNVFRRGGRA
jgi:sulfoquinovose isomerase